MGCGQMFLFILTPAFATPVLLPTVRSCNRYDEGEPTFPNTDNLTLFDEDGRTLTNGPGKDVDNTRLPKKKLLLSPRVGF